MTHPLPQSIPDPRTWCRLEGLGFVRTRGHFRFTFDQGPARLIDDAVDELVTSLLRPDQDTLDATSRA
jgi:hypothetical protein